MAVEIAAPLRLSFLAVVIATAFLFLPSARAGVLRLLRRTRWLLAVLFVAYALSLPGAPLWPDLGSAGPTREGVISGAWRVARLALMLAGLAVLLATLSRPRLIYGLYTLSRPLAWLGLDRRAFAVRLGLTLELAEHAPRTANWRAALMAPPDDGLAPTRFVLPTGRWQTRDLAVILAALLLVALAWA